MKTTRITKRQSTGALQDASACARCHGQRWVCEDHPDQPWEMADGSGCSCGAGMPCPDCNPGAAPMPGSVIVWANWDRN